MDSLFGNAEISDKRIVEIVNEIREEKDKPSFSKIIVPLQYLIIFFLIASIGLMIYQFKGIELIIIIILMFALFLSNTLLILSGKLGFQLAMLKIPTMKKYAGDAINIRFEDSGQGHIKIEKAKQFISFSGNLSMAKVETSYFHEPDIGLPINVAVEGWPSTFDVRRQFNQEPLSKIKRELKTFNSVAISIFHLGRHRWADMIEKIRKYVVWTFYGVIIVGVLVLATLYFTSQINTFFQEHGEAIVQTIESAKAAAEELGRKLAEEGNKQVTELIPVG